MLHVLEFKNERRRYFIPGAACRLTGHALSLGLSGTRDDTVAIRPGFEEWVLNRDCGPAIANSSWSANSKVSKTVYPEDDEDRTGIEEIVLMDSQ